MWVGNESFNNICYTVLVSVCVLRTIVVLVSLYHDISTRVVCECLGIIPGNRIQV
jgi:hypothetical protein